MTADEEKRKKDLKNSINELNRLEKTSFSIDVQLHFLGGVLVQEYVQNKPRPVGLKKIVLTSSKGIVPDFKIYQGSTTPFENKDLRLGPSVGLHLVKT